eukprot:CAMPEP_0174717732 /NCGR_PEP_ID=MMETSP1094-20130205/27060_1 /TAXON_ID=156173 /ORGANISM="Chrysochromulina brevifilum, Strain UTEX LB 985" /LENGTH=76 /DNA_ID=CAMNT_0015917715 /DNA_START=29 /DNA_END=259 /DNA_ORIENTATION=+
MKVELGQTVIAMVAASERAPKKEKRAVVIIKKDGRMRLKVDMDDYMGGSLWTWVDDADVKEVLTEVPIVPEEELMM